MVLPILAGAGAAILGGIFGSKKGDTINNANVYHSPYETYSPQYAQRYSNTYAPTYSVQIDSPNAYMSKKDVITSDASGLTSGLWKQPQEYAQKQTGESGVDITKIAIIGVIGLVAYGFVRSK